MTKEREISLFLQRLKGFGISEEDFRRTEDLIANRWGYETTAEETYLVILNQLAGKHCDQPYLVSRVYFHIRDHLVLGGKNPRIAISEGQRWFLKGLMEDGVDCVMIRTAGDNKVCPECRSLDEVEIEITEAFNQLPVPSKCTSDHCRCSYIDPNELNKNAQEEKLLSL
jgi:hypothetical protein